MIRGPRKPPDTTDVYLARLGDRLRILRVALTEDNALRELAETPLMLTIVTLAYQDAPTEGRVVSDSTVARRKQLFDTYIERMFSRRGVSVHYTRDQTVKWLAWLAWGMQQNQTVFFLENLQPVLLRTRRQYQQYWFVDRWLGVLVCVLVDGLVGGLVKGWIGALSFGLVFGLTLGLMVACFGGMPNRYPGASPRLWSQLYDVCIGAGVAILTLGVLGELIFGLSGGMAFGLVFGLIGGLLGSLAGHPSLRVRAVVSVETLRWSWRQVPASVGNGIVIGLVGGLI